MALVTNQAAELKKRMEDDSQDTKLQDPTMTGRCWKGNKIMILGIVAIEDVVEKALGANIMDENDYDKKYYIRFSYSSTIS